MSMSDTDCILLSKWAEKRSDSLVFRITASAEAALVENEFFLSLPDHIRAHCKNFPFLLSGVTSYLFEHRTALAK